MYAASFSALVLISLAGSISVTNARTLEPQTMHDWTVRCTDARYCIAETKGTSPQGDTLLFKLERSNKPDAKIFVTSAPDGKNLSLKSHISVSVTGHDFRFFGQVKKIYDGNEAAFIEKSTNQSIQKLKQGRFAEVTIDFDGVDKIKYDVSLQGVTSVLAMMDVVQGRLDREDAAVVVGGEAKTVLSHYDMRTASAPPKPVADQDSEAAKDPESDIVYPDEDQSQNTPNEESGLGDPDLIYDTSKLPDAVLMPGYRMLSCDLPSTVEAWGAQTINLEPGVFLYLVPCNNADVNVPYYAALEVAGSVDTLEFQVPASATGQPGSLLTNPQWDKQTESLISTKYFSVNRDCGQYERHAFSGEESRFYLSEYRLKENCDGKVSLPETYPMEWNGEGD